MKELNIPIYRAKRINGSEYVKGLLTAVYDDGTCEINGCYLCITETLSIHFPNMLDAKNKKIFASLNPKGIGGDIDDTFYCEDYVFIFDTQETIPYYDSYSSYLISGEIKE